VQLQLVGLLDRCAATARGTLETKLDIFVLMGHDHPWPGNECACVTCWQRCTGGSVLRDRGGQSHVPSMFHLRTLGPEAAQHVSTAVPSGTTDYHSNFISILRALPPRRYASTASKRNWAKSIICPSRKPVWPAAWWIPRTQPLFSEHLGAPPPTKSGSIQRPCQRHL